jgi:hypothetical protein
MNASPISDLDSALEALFPKDELGYRSVTADGVNYGIYVEDGRILIYDGDGDTVCTTTKPDDICTIVDCYALGLAHGEQRGERQAQRAMRDAQGARGRGMTGFQAGFAAVGFISVICQTPLLLAYFLTAVHMP